MGKTLKILSVNVSDTSGGAARAAYRIHKAVRAMGINSRMLVKNKESEDKNVLRLSDFDKKNLFSNVSRFVQNKIKNKLQHIRWNKYPNRENVFMSDLRSVPMRGTLQKIDYDILHLHWINLRFLDINELTRINKPIVWTLHDCWPFTGVCHYFYDCDNYKTSCGNCPFLHSGKEKDLSYVVWKKKKAIYSLLNLHVVTPSHWLADAARNSALLGHFSVTVIPNTIDTILFSPGDRIDACVALNLDENKKYVLFGAMNAVLDSNKGFLQLLDALRLLELKTETEQKLELLVVGADKPLEGLETSIAVKYLGVINSDKAMVFVYNAADVMVVPSLSENLSNAIMESLACGTPVVAFNIGGNGDLIEHKQNGYLAAAFDAEDLGNGILWCLGNNNGNKLSTYARKKVVQNYSSSVISEKYVELYQRIFHEKS